MQFKPTKETERIFKDETVATLGKKFGTVTVVLDGQMSAEITTFRTETGMPTADIPTK